MDLTREIADFLRTRRDRLTPEQAGLPRWGKNRRVPGLRREEVALLAGISIDYYTRLERGDLRGVSEQVLNALAGALHLDEAEREHLFDLSRAVNSEAASRPRPRTQTAVRPGLVQLLEAFGDTPAVLRSDRRDHLATNDLGRLLYSPVHDSPYARPTPDAPPNLARFTFLDPAAKEFFPHWESSAGALTASLRQVAGHDPHDEQLSSLIGVLATRSPDFSRMWGGHQVRLHRTGGKLLHHPQVGDLELDYETLELPGDPGLAVIVYQAAPGSSTADALQLLRVLNLPPGEASGVAARTESPG